MYLDPDFVHETNVSISGKLCMYVRPSPSNVTGFHVRRMYMLRCHLTFFGREITNTRVYILICTYTLFFGPKKKSIKFLRFCHNYDCPAQVSLLRTDT